MQNQADRKQLASELEGALRRLESALTDAGFAIATIRSCVPRISTLVEVVDTMESAMSFVRQRLGDNPSEAPVHAVPQQPQPAPALEPQPAPALDPEPQTEPVVTEGMPQTYCLRLRVGSRVGALDLKSVDNAVNEQQSVTDVALIDYDGRQATLRVWISGTDDAEAARRALGESLRSRLGDSDAAEIDIEFEERAAA